MAKIIVFKYNPYHGDHNAYEEDVEFGDDATEEEISKEWADWLLERAVEHATWYEKEWKI